MAYTTINKPTDYFNTKLFNGTGSSNSVTGVGFQPDFTWIKTRDSAETHILTDAVRGATKTIRSSSLAAETTVDQDLTAFGSDGFTVGTNNRVNKSGDKMVSWNWKAGGGQGSSNTDGSINTTYTSVNATSGCSISKYVGTSGTGTVGHGLGVAPSMIIIKSLDNGNKNWIVYHKSLTNAGSIYFDETSASSTNYDYFADTSPTASVFTVKKDGDYNEANNSGTNFIAYSFAEKQGYSKFGKYTGNGSNTNGTFIYLGFKPAFVILKKYDAAGYWSIMDNKRPGINPIDDTLKVNVSDTEADIGDFDFLANGFKLYANTGNVNGSDSNYIYMAFAEAPLVGTNGVTAKAR